MPAREHVAGPDRDALAEHRAAARRRRRRRSRTPAATMQSRSYAARADLGAVAARPSARRARPRRPSRRRPSTTSDADVRARGDRARRARRRPAGRCARRRLHVVGDRQVSRAPRRSATRGPRRCPRGCRRSPAGSARASRCPSSRRVGVRAVAGPWPTSARPDLALDRDVAAGRDQVEHRALQHVGAGGDERSCLDLVGAGLLEEAVTACVLVAGARARRPTGPRPARAPSVPDRAGRLVLGDLRGEVDVGQHVAVEHQEALVEADCSSAYFSAPAGAARLGLLDVAQAQPEREPSPSTLRTLVGQEAARRGSRRRRRGRAATRACRR